MTNPYDPQQPTSPETFAGRQEVVGKAKGLISAAREYRRSGSLLMHGHRGSGKTSALRKIESIVRSSVRGSLVVEIPLRGRSTEGALLRDIVDEVRRVALDSPNSFGRIRGAMERVKALNVSLLGTGVSVGRAESPPTSNALTMWRQCLSAVSRAPLLCICVDDAEQLDRRGLGTIKTIAESETATPILLAVAGGPDLMKRLAEPDASPVARVFSGAVLDLESFTEAETEEALFAPLRAHRGTGRWSGEAIRQVWRLSHGYPYLVKCLAAASYRPGTTLSAGDVGGAVPGALKIASSWLEREIPRASDQDLIAFGRIARMGKTNFRTSEVLGLGVQNQYLDRLVRLGVLRKVARGHYELRKAPVIAYYHLLRRNLPG